MASVVALALGSGGCGDSAPSNPTWTEDVKPILIANCVKCHSHPARFGAPDTFRLDVYEDGPNDADQYVLGAGSMAQFVHERTAAETMPPTIPLTSRQIDILDNWFASRPEGEPPVRGEARAGNRAPTMTLERRLDASVVGERLIVLYFIDDEDFDVVTGTLAVTPSGGMPVTLTGELRSGRGQVEWDIGVFAEGDYSVTAQLADGNTVTTVDLGAFTVAHAGGNTAPTAQFMFPFAGAILSVDASPATIAFDLVDPDPVGTWSYDLDAFIGDEVVSIQAGTSATPGPQTIPFDTTALRESPNWRLRLTLTDGTSSREIVTPTFVVSQRTTTRNYADAQAVFVQHCGKCHPGSTEVFLTGLFFDLTGFASAQRMLPDVYRRAVLERNMPPRSANLIFPDDPPITDAEREILADWLLGGAPEN